jgi:hypothetical protein
MNRSAMLWRPGAADSLDQSKVPQSTVFDVYGPFPRANATGIPGTDYGAAASRITAAGHRVVRSAGMYLDQLCDPDPDGRHHGTYWGFFQVGRRMVAGLAMICLLTFDCVVLDRAEQPAALEIVWLRSIHKQKISFRRLLRALIAYHHAYPALSQGWVYYNATHDPLYGLDKALGARPELVIGAKANMWGEHVDADNFMPRVWPRASVLAERLWSAVDVTSVAEAEPRLHEFRCRLVSRGIAAAPIGAYNFGEGGPYHKCYCQTELVFDYSPPALPPPSLAVGGPMLTLTPPRIELAAAAVGTVLVFAGGLDTGTGTVSDVVDVFDMAHGGRHTALRLSVARAFDDGQNVAAVCRGKIYFAGGAYANGTKSAIVDVFDMATTTFDRPLTLSVGRSFLAATALEGQGRVLFGGGELTEDETHPHNSTNSDVIDIWSVEQGKWLSPAKLSVGRQKLTATTLGDETVLFAGGFRSNTVGAGSTRAKVDIFTAATGVWSSARLAQGRMRLASASAGDCAVFARGEVNMANTHGSGIVDLYCSGEWSVAELSIRRYELASAELGSYVYFAGGTEGGQDGNPRGGPRVDMFDSATREWTHFDLPTPRYRLGAAATTEGGGLVCFSGGGVDGEQVDCVHGA